MSRSYTVVFNDGSQARTAFLDRAVDHLRRGTVVEIRHVRRPGKLTVTADDTVILSDADDKAVQSWQRDANKAGLDITINFAPTKPEQDPPTPSAPPAAPPAVAEPLPYRPFRRPGEPFHQRRIHVPGKGSYDPLVHDGFAHTSPHI